MPKRLQQRLENFRAMPAREKLAAAGRGLIKSVLYGGLTVVSCGVVVTAAHTFSNPAPPFRDDCQPNAPIPTIGMGDHQFSLPRYDRRWKETFVEREPERVNEALKELYDDGLLNSMIQIDEEVLENLPTHHDRGRLIAMAKYLKRIDGDILDREKAGVINDSNRTQFEAYLAEAKALFNTLDGSTETGRGGYERIQEIRKAIFSDTIDFSMKPFVETDIDGNGPWLDPETAEQLKALPPEQAAQVIFEAYHFYTDRTSYEESCVTFDYAQPNVQDFFMRQMVEVQKIEPSTTSP